MGASRSPKHHSPIESKCTITGNLRWLTANHGAWHLERVRLCFMWHDRLVFKLLSSRTTITLFNPIKFLGSTYGRSLLGVTINTVHVTACSYKTETGPKSYHLFAPCETIRPSGELLLKMGDLDTTLSPYPALRSHMMRAGTCVECSDCTPGPTM